MPDRRPKRDELQGALAAKTCAACGRTLTWRKSLARNWDEVKFCSDACRAHRPGPADRALEAEILRLLHERGAGKTICPSEAARAVAGASDDGEWQALMEPARAAARRLVSQNRIVITQGGRVVDASTAKGPIRLRLR